MSTHLRTQIRNAAVAALTGLATTGARVFANRLRVLTAAELPCLLVTIDRESVEYMTLTPAPHTERQMVLMVRGVAQAAANLDDRLDQVALEVENALCNSLLGGLVREQPRIVSLAYQDDDVTATPVGVITMDFAVTYYVNAGAAGTAV